MSVREKKKVWAVATIGTALLLKMSNIGMMYR